jgi:hypothetical protein
MKSTRKPTPVLREVLIQFSVEQDVPDHQLLDSYIEQYPQFESQLRKLALELIEASRLDNLHADEMDVVDPRDAAQAPVYGSAFQTRYFEKTGRVFGEAAGDAGDAGTIESRLSSLDRPAYRSLATRLGINPLVLNQLRDREIDAQTIPRRFMERFAKEFDATVEVALRFFSLPPAVSQLASFKSDEKPQSDSKESFESALSQSGLSAEQISVLMD